MSSSPDRSERRELLRVLEPNVTTGKITPVCIESFYAANKDILSEREIKDQLLLWGVVTPKVYKCDLKAVVNGLSTIHDDTLRAWGFKLFMIAARQILQQPAYSVTIEPLWIQNMKISQNRTMALTLEYTPPSLKELINSGHKQLAMLSESVAIIGNLVAIEGLDNPEAKTVITLAIEVAKGEALRPSNLTGEPTLAMCVTNYDAEQVRMFSDYKKEIEREESAALLEKTLKL